MIHRLVFDTTDATSIAQSSNVGAYIRASDGTLIDAESVNSVDRLAVDSTLKDGAGVALTSTLVGSDQALDVNMVNDIAVDIDGIYDNPDNLLPDNIGLIGNTRAAAPDETGQVERITVGVASSDDVVAANVHGIDSNAFNMVFDGTTWDRLRGTAGAAHISDGGGSITVDGTVAVTQSTSPWVVSDAALANTAIQQDTASVSVTGALFASPLADRKYTFMYNNGSKAVYIGAAGVTTANGFPVFPGSLLEARIGSAVAVHAIAESGTQNMRLLQLS